MKLRPSLYGPVCSVASIAIACVLMFVTSIVDWFNVRMAVLAPIIATLCYGPSMQVIMERSTRNLCGILIGGVSCILWLLIIRACSYAIDGTRNYNQFIAVACSLPWLVSFHALLPRKVVSVSTTCLMFLTLTAYCGDSAAPDAFPLRAVLAGSVGALVSMGVGSLFHFIFIKSGENVPVLSQPEKDLWSLWDFVIHDAVLGQTSRDTDAVKQACMHRILSVEAPDEIGKALMGGFSKLCAMKSLTSFRGSSQECLPGEICTGLAELHSRRLCGKKLLTPCLDRLDALVADTVDSGSKSVAPIRILSMLSLMRGFLKDIEQMRTFSQAKPAWTLWSYLKASFKFKRPTWRSLAEALRFAVVMVALGELLVYWDARDETVDTYALWAFVPTLLLAERVVYVGQGIVDGALYIIASLLGSGFGVLALLMNGGGRTSYIAEFTVIVVVGLAIQSWKPKWGDAGLVFIVAWMICVLGNYGLDPSEATTDDANGLNSLWRCALYRSAITCFSVFFMALMFIVIPLKFAAKSLEDESLQFLAGLASSTVESLAQDTCTMTSQGESDERVMNHVFVTQSFSDRLTFARAECTRHRHCLVSKNELVQLWASFCGLCAVAEQGIGDPNTSIKSQSCLIEAIRGVMRELEPLSTAAGIKQADVSLIKPRARQLREALNFARKALLTSDVTSETLACDGLLQAICVGTLLRDFLRSWVRIEDTLGLHEDFDRPTALRDISDDEADLDVYV